MKPLQMFIGYDPRQPVAFHVAAHSIQSRSTKPVSITRLQLNQLPITRRGLTEFTFSRFLVPYLSDFEGYSAFIDADVLCRGDIAQLAKSIDARQAVSVVMHEGKLAFERASLMVFNNTRCRMLTPEFVQDTKNSLMDLSWAGGWIGSIPHEWNHLVGYDVPNPNAKIAHFTKGIPCWPETKDSEFAEEWMQTLRSIGQTVSFQELMGKSVHVQPQMAMAPVPASIGG